MGAKNINEYIVVRFNNDRTDECKICGYKEEILKAISKLGWEITNVNYAFSTSEVGSMDLILDVNTCNQSVTISKVVFNEPATIVLWSDGIKTVVKCRQGETFDKEKGLAMAIIKRLCGNTGAYNEIFKEWCE